MSKQDLFSLVSIFLEFFKSYKGEIDALRLAYPSEKSINVDFKDLGKFDATIADQLLSEPEIVIDAAEEAIRDMNLTLSPKAGDFKPHVRFFNIPNPASWVRELGADKMGKLVAFKGEVHNCHGIQYKIKKAHYSCQACGEQYDVIVSRNFKPPRMCVACKKLALVPNEEKSQFVNYQEVQMEEISDGKKKGKLEAWLEDDLFNKLTPGATVELTGILRTYPTQTQKQKVHMAISPYLEVVHIRPFTPPLPPPPKEKPLHAKPSDHRFDVDIITTGKSRSQVEKIETILDIIKDKTKEQEAVPKQEVLDEAEAAGLDPSTAKRILTELMRKGEIYELSPGRITLFKKDPIAR